MHELSKAKLRIVDAAIELIAEKGYNTVSVRDIARAVGIKDASIYSHFASKDEILETIFTIIRDEYLEDRPSPETLDAILAQCSPARFLEIGFQRFKKRMSDQRQRSAYLILLREKYDDSRAASLWNEHMANSLAYLKTVFDKMAENGWIRSENTDLMAQSCQYAESLMRDEYVRRCSRGLDTSPTEKQIKEHHQFFFDLVKK